MNKTMKSAVVVCLAVVVFGAAATAGSSPTLSPPPFATLVLTPTCEPRGCGPALLPTMTPTGSAVGTPTYLPLIRVDVLTNSVSGSGGKHEQDSVSQAKSQ